MRKWRKRRYDTRPSARADYKNAVRFDETVLIVLKVEEFNGFKMRITYRVIARTTAS